MGKEYTYSMPESFMQDQSVPARWRVLGIINGFAIAGKPCYASNEWFAKELNCSERTITSAFEELEKSGEIHCERTKRTRVAFRLRSEIATNFYLRWKPTAISDSNQLLPISDSISDSELGEAKAPQILEVFEPEEDARLKRPTKAKYADAKIAFSWLPNQQKSWDRNITELECGLLLFGRGEEDVRKFVKYIKNHENDDHFNWVFVKPSDYERKWEDIKAYAKRNS